MIDFVHALLPFRHTTRIEGGIVLSAKSMEDVMNGEPEWITSKKKKFEGSFDSAGLLRSSDNHFENGVWTHIWVGGSPKVLQGHNLFGTSDPRLLAAALGRVGLLANGIEVDPFTLNAWKQGRGVTFTMLDVTEMMHVGTETDAAQWIESAQEHTRVKYRGRGVSTKGTLYFGKSSEFWALKLYQKFPEVQARKKGHKLPDAIPMREALIDYARGTVRAEFRFQSKFLKRYALSDASTWTPDTARQLWEKYMQQLELFSNRPLGGSDIEALPAALRSTYVLWREGRDVSGILSRPTFYRHMSKLKTYGINIALPAPAAGRNVIPLLRTITAQPKAIPSWAYGTPLLLAA